MHGAYGQWIRPAVVLLAIVFAGCSSCQEKTAPPPAGGTAGEAKSAGEVAAATPTHRAVRMPTVRTLPTVGEAPARPEVEEGTQEQPGAQEPEARPGQPRQPGAAVGQDDDYEYEEEADCIILADADPDFGPPPLQVQFESDYECYEDSRVTVNWNFGDGSSSSEVNPSHSYMQVGEFLATVTLTTADGKTTTDEIDISVEEDDEEY